MTTQVFARKWRPGTFDDLIGQEHVAKTLRSAIRQKRIANSYLFTGPRGTGKTSSARILAKAINCTNNIDGDACNECATCVSINENRNMDLIELDAASNRGVDEIREIVGKINFMPSQSKKTIYIVDEAHMLTNQASNAFLKTLEEPPNHVVFILCTTESQNILPTIVSRCQRYDFRRITVNAISGQLQKIAIEENIKISNDAVQLISKNASGSLRDAENLFEQIVVSYNHDIDLSHVEDMLGVMNDYTFIPLVRGLLTRNLAECLSIVNDLVWDGVEPRTIHKQTLDLLLCSMKISCGASDVVTIDDDLQSELCAILDDSEIKQLLHTLNIWSTLDSRRGYIDLMPLEIAAGRICTEETGQQPSANVLSNNRRQQYTSGHTQPTRQTLPPRKPPSSRNPVRPQSEVATPKDELLLLWKETTAQLSKENDESYNVFALLNNLNIKLSDDKQNILIECDTIQESEIQSVLDSSNIKNTLVEKIKSKNNSIQNIELASNYSEKNANYLVDTLLSIGGVITNANSSEIQPPV